MNLQEWQRKYQCGKCSDVIYSRYDGQYVSCKCGSISVDQTPYYSRHIGNLEDFKEVKEVDAK